jgi:hypothetical protein
MHKPTYEELEQSYRDVLKKLVHVTRRADEYEQLLAAKSAQDRQSAQSIDSAVEAIKLNTQA